ncbi:hypothetical protein [Actinoplanes teichomyceticus]|uniref:hypothetical protein n=1 Tax=Actinoplanes teichomyceticus TaxID=1867 RepID=UPI0013DDA1F3|nr:hypothetical protein [Actinoplanes teichomyceticus]
MGAGRDPAEVDRRLGEPQRGAPQRRGRGGGDPVVSGRQPAQRGPGLRGPVEVGGGRGRRQFGDPGDLVAAGPADPRHIRLAAGVEHPVPYAGIAFSQVGVDLVDPCVTVPVTVGGPAAEGVGEQTGERGRLRPGRRGDHHPAAALRGARRAEVGAGVDRAAGASVQQDHDLPGLAAVHQRVDAGHVDRGVGRSLHDRVRGGEIETAARAGEQDATEVDQQAVLRGPAVAQRLQPLIGVPGLRVLQEVHVEAAQTRIAEDGGERPHVRRRHRISVQDGIVVVLDRHHNRQPSPAHRITLGPWCDVPGRPGRPDGLRTVPVR